MYASEHSRFVRANLVAFPHREKSSSQRIIHYIPLTLIQRKYFSLIEKDFRSLAELFQLQFGRMGETGYETIYLSKEFLLIGYQVATQAVVGSTNLEDLNFLERARQNYPRLFSANSIVAQILQGIDSLVSQP
jgi:hypothetical protein